MDNSCSAYRRRRGCIFWNSVCANLHKTVEQILEILRLKFMANFWHFKFGLGLCSSSSSRQASL